MALVFNGNVDALVGDAVMDVDGFGGVEFVAVLDGVDESFFEGEFEGEEVGFGEVVFFAAGEDFGLHVAGLGEGADDGTFGPGLVGNVGELEFVSGTFHLTAID